jgi:hypothetical protein
MAFAISTPSGENQLACQAAVDYTSSLAAFELFGNTLAF